MSIHYVPGSVLARADVKTKARGAGDFPGSPVVKNLIFYCRGHGSIPSRELRYHMPCCMAKKKKKKKPKAKTQKSPEETVESIHQAKHIKTTLGNFRWTQRFTPW